ncbi:MAG: hypothetical protein M1540_04110 [Candidatus Bathyarchaeota archaeon]|nr:hypothetical protein [Chloroflexota bacterium]MCL5876979.1 hypothetical protein [Candidatus Bathyarchaeota archaeon]
MHTDGSACGINHNHPTNQTSVRTQNAVVHTNHWLLLCIGVPLQQLLLEKTVKQRSKTVLTWVSSLVKRPIVLTTAYLIIAWALMVSYQIFTQTAVATVAASLSGSAPLIALWLTSSSNLTAFICGFAWMFVLSAFAASLMFGKERRLSIQFLVSLGLTLAGSALLGLLSEAGLDLANPSLLSGPFTALFGNVAFAGFYLALPFLFMLAMDLRFMWKRK